MSDLNKCTCVKVNKEKMDLIKSKGLNLQDILDDAMDKELNLSNISDSEQTINDLNANIIKLKKERNQLIQDYEKKMDALIKILDDLKFKEENYYNKQIEFLELKIEFLKNNQ